MFAEKAGGFIVFVIQPQGLVSRNMNPGIFGAVFAFAVGDDSGIVAEHCFKLVVTLFAQFVPVAQKQGRFRQALGLVQAPQQVGGNDGFTGAGG